MVVFLVASGLQSGTKDQPLTVIKSIWWNQTARRVVKPAGLWLIEPPLFSR
jgi:hypothetical protein